MGTINCHNCKHGKPSETGMVWCEKYGRFVSGSDIEGCPDYEPKE